MAIAAAIVTGVALAASGEIPWSFAPLVQPAVPSVVGRSAHPIDAFIDARLRETGVAATAPADATTSLRRLSLDLTGLPPTPAELDAFASSPPIGAAAALDAGASAWSREVERLLASPRFGEHQARYWLDAVRYADTHGFHFDNERSIWKYRDWVVNAFNSNMPFDRFTIEQLAGDLLPDATDENRIASGFIRCNPTTNEGGSIDDEVIFRNASDRADTYSTVWLGLTMHCAQCHDHKFDPLDQRDYYSLYAFFNSTQEASMDGNLVDPEPVLRVASQADNAEIARLREGVAQGASLIESLIPSLADERAQWMQSEAEVAARRWQSLAISSVSAESGTVLTAAGGVIAASGEVPAADTYEIVCAAPAGPITALRLDADLPANGVGPGRAPNGNFVLTEIELVARNAEGVTTPIKLSGAAATREQQGYPVANAVDGVVNHDNGWACLNTAQQPGPATAVFRLEAPTTIPVGSQLVVRLLCRSMFAQHTLASMRLAVRTESGAPVLHLSPWRLSKPLPGASRQQAYGTDSAALEVRREADLSSSLEMREVTQPDGEVIDIPFTPVASVFAARTIRTDRPVSMRAMIAHDDALKVFINGRLVFARDVDQAVTAPPTAVILPLDAGENLLVLKIVNGGGEFGYSFKLDGEFPDPMESRVHGLLALDGPVCSEAQKQEMARWHAESVCPEGRVAATQVATQRSRLQGLESALPPTLIAREMAAPRAARVLMRGQYDKPGDVAERATPKSLPPMRDTQPKDRSGLAQWTVDPANPLTARVLVNRIWQQYFGVGLVRTSEDFGVRGERPSHPELLDWLAADLVANGWNLKRLHTLIVTSAAYRRSAAAEETQRTSDPENRLLARGPRFRLDAEVIRDQALWAGGILVERLGGAGVRPVQPDGVWEVVAFVGSNTQFYQTGKGDDLHRRSLYSFHKRTAPPASMSTFDAPSREASCVRRERTNTPLQALVTMNDAQFVEASRALAQRILLEGGTTDSERMEFLFRTLTARFPQPRESSEMAAFLAESRKAFANDPARAQALLQLGATPRDPNIDPIEHAAWTMVANLVLNLDESLCKG